MATLQNVIYKGRDNPVVMNFAFTGEFAENGLNNFTEISLTIGAEVYKTTTTPDNLIIVSNTQLKLMIGDTTALDDGYYTPEIIGTSLTYDDGYLLSGKQKQEIGSIIVKPST